MDMSHDDTVVPASPSPAPISAPSTSPSAPSSIQASQPTPSVNPVLTSIDPAVPQITPPTPNNKAPLSSDPNTSGPAAARPAPPRMTPLPKPLTKLNPSSPPSSSPTSPLHRSTSNNGVGSSSRPNNGSSSNHHHLNEHVGLAQKSPCFIHSQLDKGASLSEWIQRREDANMHGGGSASSHAGGGGGGAPPLRTRNKSQLSFAGDDEDDEDCMTTVDDDEDEDDSGSLTRQLAETAVGVREMSKQLGRARVRSHIHNVLIVTKARDNRLIKLTRELALYLMLRPPGGNGSKRGMTVYVDAQLRHSRRFDAAGILKEYPQIGVPVNRRRTSSSASVNTMSGFSSDGGSSQQGGEGQLRYWTSDMCSKSPDLFDFVVTLGGDGTVLFTSWLFQRIVPPVLPFALGSLGFLTNFDFNDYAKVMDNVIDRGVRVNLRMRFTCTVYRAVAPDNATAPKAVKNANGDILMQQVGDKGWEALEGGGAGQFASNGINWEGKPQKEKEIMCFKTRPVESFEVLNDLVVDRGPSPYVSLLELFGDEHHMTTVQADGLTVSTPTGSTAYSLSAGGSLVHPQIPAILITPICPHTLSFRPMLLPDSMELRICVPYNSRSTAWASFDGRGRVELKQGDHIKVTASRYPFPTVCADKQSTDWFHAIQRTLRWNEREKQKSFVILEEGRQGQQSQRPVASSAPHFAQKESPEEEAATQTSSAHPRLEAGAAGDAVAETEADEDDGKFDIDDSSAPGTTPNTPPEAMNPSSPPTDLPVSPISGSLPILSNGFNSSLKSHKSGVESPDRFVSAFPAPPKLNSRHMTAALLDAGGVLTDSPISHIDGNGERDDIHSPQSMRANGSRIPGTGQREPIETPTSSTISSPSRPITDEHPQDVKTPRPLSNKHHTAVQRPLSRTRKHQSSHHHNTSHHKHQPEEEKSRAFAFFGADESDSGLSESDD